MRRAARYFKLPWLGWRASEVEHLLPAARLLPSTASPRRVARRLAFSVLMLAVFSAAAPWRQNITGSGRVIAFSPNERPQAVQATISGRIGQWHVVEGDRVQEGDILVDLIDNDPDRLSRIETARTAAVDRLAAYRSQVIAYQERLSALERSQQAQIAAAEAEVRVARDNLQAKRELLTGSEAQVETAELQLRRVEDLTRQGLASVRERELAALGATHAGARLRSSRASVRAAQNSLSTRRAALDRAHATTEADIRSGIASLRTAETQVASAQGGLASAESRLAQQQAQTVRAPRDGVIQRILVQQGGVQISRGETLADLVPDAESRAVEIYVDGNDAALISPGRDVRVLFEGWPGIQFAGWPSVAVGTFHGQVLFVDPSDDGRGDFRVVVTPDPDDEPWPAARFLRQGTRAKGWVLLDEVSVGFEMWRQLNGFPPALDHAPDMRGEP